MKQFAKPISIILKILNIFLAITAFLGGIQLLTNFYTPPVEQLQGSIFKDFTIPGLALSVIVGGSALFAAILLIRESKFGILSSVAAGVIIMFFEFVEVLVIGSPAGPARFMQIMYFGLGILIVIAALGLWFIDLLSNQGLSLHSSN